MPFERTKNHALVLSAWIPPFTTRNHACAATLQILRPPKASLVSSIKSGVVQPWTALASMLGRRSENRPGFQCRGAKSPGRRSAQWLGARRRAQDTDDSALAQAGSGGPGPWLPIPGLWASIHGRPPREALGRRRESIPKLVETRVTSGRSGCGMSLAIGMDDPEFLLNRGTERREVAIAE